MGKMGKLPFGAGEATIDLLGHMRPDPQLEREVLGQTFIGPVGLGTRLDGIGLATKAWSRFGFSFIELGPVTDETKPAKNLRREAVEEAIVYDSPSTVSNRELVLRLKDSPSPQVHLIARLKPEASGSPWNVARETIRLATPLLSKISIFSVDLSRDDVLPSWSADQWQEFWQHLRADLIGPVSWLLVVPVAGRNVFPEGGLGGVSGVILDAYESSAGSMAFGPQSRTSLLEAIRRARSQSGETLTIIAAGGIHQPADAAAALEAGATLVQIDTGLVYSGPGLPKRINEAVLTTLPPIPSLAGRRLAKQSWFWMASMGLGMLVGSLLALWIASTRIVMPYDEAFCGITRAQLEQINARLLPFMSHDRVTLAGTMIAIGLLYMSLSWFGVRCGHHWAKIAVLASAGTGFFSFFLFLGFDYFDPFHGFVTAVLFQLFVQGMVGELPVSSRSPAVDWTETAEWRRAQWGQLLLVLHSVGLMGAGVVICGVGIGDVFVSTDLNFLGTQLIDMQEANPRLVPLVAHDRATLGGMLIASGLVYLLASLWGMRRGEKWLWHTFFWSGLSAYFCAISIHFVVGYFDWQHLLPAFVGLGLFLTGLGLCRKWLSAKSPFRTEVLVSTGASPS